MTQPDHEDLADALAKLVSGEIAPSDELTVEPIRPVRALSPSSPGTPLPEAVEEPTEESGRGDQAIEENDWIMPALATMDFSNPSAIHDRPKDRVARRPLYQTLQFRQTIIPILLTCGVLTLVVSSLKFVLAPDSLFSDLPPWLPVALMAAGALLLILAVMNMFAVKSQLVGNRK